MDFSRPTMGAVMLGLNDLSRRHLPRAVSAFIEFVMAKNRPTWRRSRADKPARRGRPLSGQGASERDRQRGRGLRGDLDGGCGGLIGLEVVGSQLDGLAMRRAVGR